MEYSFDPLISTSSEILILGSLPGVKSLREEEYYAHPQNRFWKIMFAIYDTAYSNDYKSKCSLLLAHRIALWDVLKCADRTGSSDSNIKNQVPNDIPGLLSNYPNIKFILFNGNFSLTCFKKYFGEPVLPYSLLLSTSPALAGRDKERFEMWKKAVSTGRVLS